jgi:hypothetical protein
MTDIGFLINDLQNQVGELVAEHDALERENTLLLDVMRAATEDHASDCMCNVCMAVEAWTNRGDS